MSEFSAPIFAIASFGISLVIGIRMGLLKALIFTALACAMLLAAGCGGGTAEPAAEVWCPTKEEFQTFVGPLPAECLVTALGAATGGQ